MLINVIYQLIAIGCVYYSSTASPPSQLHAPTGKKIQNDTSRDFRRMFSFFTQRNIGLNEESASNCSRILITQFNVTTPARLAMILKLEQFRLENICTNKQTALLIIAELEVRFGKNRSKMPTNSIEGQPQMDVHNIIASYDKHPPPSPRFIKSDFMTTEEVNELVQVESVVLFFTMC